MAKKSPRIPVDTLYVVTVITANKKFEGRGLTMGEALADVKIDTFKAKAVLRIEYKDKKKEIVLFPIILRKLLLPLQRTFFEKRLSNLLR